jgi:hypothetical protein
LTDRYYRPTKLNYPDDNQALDRHWLFNYLIV